MNLTGLLVAMDSRSRWTSGNAESKEVENSCTEICIRLRILLFLIFLGGTDNFR